MPSKSKRRQSTSVAVAVADKPVEKPARALPQKDEEERELEALIFGDDEGFRKGIAQLGDEEFGVGYTDEQDRDVEVTDGTYQQPEDDGMEEVADNDLFFLDDAPGTGPDVDDDESEEYISEDEAPHVREAAWYDSDDERITVSLASHPRLRKLRRTEADDHVTGKDYQRRLRLQFERVYPVPEWALPAGAKAAARAKRLRAEADSDDESADEMDQDLSADPLKTLFQRAEGYVRKTKSAALAPGTIDISRLKDANQQQLSAAAIQTMSFHPTHPLVLTGGYDRMVRIYHLDGKVNPLVTSLHVKSMPIQTAQFHPDGKRVFIGGRRRYFYIWDLETGTVEKISRMYGHESMQRSMETFKLSPCGRYVALLGQKGWVNILNATTGQWITGVKVEGEVADLVWWAAGEGLTIANTAGELWEWNSDERRIVGRWRDEGGFATVRIALGGEDSRYIAVGSKTGIVNVYDRRKMTSTTTEPKPLRTLEQLTTSVHTLAFSHDGQVLAMASRVKKDMLKLVHLPSGTVFKNWPTMNTPLGKIGAVEFSQGSEMLCIGNEQGHVRLYRLAHYSA
ncbi:WD40 repeat-like protein [Saitoella complicata NRRL Y-17804]|uniref:Uncharacterized protein n=1 Tax=Saitoella complicata (strain BCRC 22490 / CBS 7301 / JCM 7358 / NBRC 10748 / NRRL Y-17804) TaxID=698492 RepID=A0A0E9NJ35_SAICN|nr:WD40 repeat-like protein [Saitoella complicata NRRL Y-17804]ODQ50019.1 WD40 repeat-like protein [Saitoella complicata NRRL Y-17804]GAO49711.1 hypothetical protein G7K_3855-t1 [Saitoella complicata NRRL Y-17804]